MDIQYLEKLLGVLKGSGVTSFASGELELEFTQPATYSLTVPHGTPDTKDHTVNLPINEAELPPDLRTDNINSMDTILNWSGSGDDGERPMPGTDIPIFNDIQTHPRQMAMPADPP